MDQHARIAHRYLQFADNEARGSSPTFETWARTVADDPALCERLATLTERERQPNLVFAALRWHGATPGDENSLRRGLLENWARVRATIGRRGTQTNEAARCAVLLPVLHRIEGPIALIELGASAGLCLIPDRYSYVYSDGTVVDPPSGPADLVIECRVTAGTLPPGLTTPSIVWRAGIDRNPLDPADPDTAAWLTTLVWPEHEQRRRRLTAALDLAARSPIRLRQGDIRDPDRIGALVAEAPAGATPVLLHSATLGYLDADERARTCEAIARTGARWIGFEGRGVLDTTRRIASPLTPDTLFVATLDREPLALADGHGRTMTLLS